MPNAPTCRARTGAATRLASRIAAGPLKARPAAGRERPAANQLETQEKA